MIKIFSCLFAYRLSTIRVKAVFQRDEMHHSDPGSAWQHTAISLQLHLLMIHGTDSISGSGSLSCSCPSLLRGRLISLCSTQVINEVILYTSTLHSTLTGYDYTNTEQFLVIIKTSIEQHRHLATN